MIEHNHRFSADELFEDMRTAKLQVSRAGVYRILSKLVNAGMLSCSETETITYYERLD